jgi:hypothetical protein
MPDGSDPSAAPGVTATPRMTATAAAAVTAPTAVPTAAMVSGQHRRCCEQDTGHYS